MPGVCGLTSRKHPAITELKVGINPKTTYLSQLFAHSMGWGVRVYGNCIHNQYRALSERHITDRTYIGFDRKIYMRTTREPIRNLLKKIDFKDVQISPLRELVETYSGGKRKIYERAAQVVREKAFDRNWAKVRMFVKPDKHDICKIQEKVPRAIQYRRPEFNLLLAQYLRPVEKKIFSYVEDDGTRIFAKGRNLQQRAQDILDIYDTFENPVILCTDHSKFDSCVNVTHLRVLHRFYLKIFQSYRLQKLLSYQINNVGFSVQGLRYRVKGTRMSGDYDTSLGNNLINFFVLTAWADICNIRAKFYIDGDDALVFMSKSDLFKVDEKIFNQLGFETTLEVADLDTFEFCQSKLIRCQPPILARDPRKIISNLQVCLKRYSPTQWPRLLNGKIQCEYWANQGVPYICNYLKALLKGEKFEVPPEDMRRWCMVRTHERAVCTPQAYKDLARAWGFDHESASLLKTPVAYAFPYPHKSGPAVVKNKDIKYEFTNCSLQRIQATRRWLDLSCGERCGPNCRGPREEMVQPAVCSAEPVRTTGVRPTAPPSTRAG